MEPEEITEEFPRLLTHVVLEAVTKNALCFLDLDYEKSPAGLDGLYWVVIFLLFHLKAGDLLNNAGGPQKWYFLSGGAFRSYL